MEDCSNLGNFFARGPQTIQLMEGGGYFKLKEKCQHPAILGSQAPSAALPVSSGRPSLTPLSSAPSFVPTGFVASGCFVDLKFGAREGDDCYAVDVSGCLSTYADGCSMVEASLQYYNTNSETGYPRDIYYDVLLSGEYCSDAATTTSGTNRLYNFSRWSRVQCMPH
jgi:hypothetical protein